MLFRLLRGYLAKRYHPSQTTTAWAIPYDALLDGDANKGYVFVTNDNATAQKVTGAD